jgi:hypothetical protein
MVRITIDTEKDSTLTIQKVIHLLEQVVHGSSQLHGRQIGATAQQDASLPSAASNATLATQQNYVDMFASMPSSQPVTPSKSSFTDLFASNEQPNSSAPATYPTTTTSVNQSASSMFDMFSDDASSSPSMFSSNDFSSSASSLSHSASQSASSLLEESDAFDDDYGDDEFEAPKKNDSFHLQAYDE